MNIRKEIDYSGMYRNIDAALASDLSMTALYCEIGRLVAEQPEKGAAVAASEYLQAKHSDATGFSARSVRRMRDFYRAYEGDAAGMALAVTTGWTLNLVILSADLTADERLWYLCAAKSFGWSKQELARRIEAGACHDKALDTELSPVLY